MASKIKKTSLKDVEKLITASDTEKSKVNK